MNLLQVTGVYNNTSYPCKIRTGILAGSYTPSLWESHQDPGDILVPEIFTWIQEKIIFLSGLLLKTEFLVGFLLGSVVEFFPHRILLRKLPTLAGIRCQDSWQDPAKILVAILQG